MALLGKYENLYILIKCYVMKALISSVTKILLKILSLDAYQVECQVFIISNQILNEKYALAPRLILSEKAKKDSEINYTVFAYPKSTFPHNPEPKKACLFHNFTC